MFNKFIKLLLFIIIIYQTPVYSKSTSLNEINSRNLSNYFSGIVAFENKDNTDALRFFNSSTILLNKHDVFLQRYIYSLVIDNKIPQAINIIKKNSKNNSIDFFNAYLLLTIDSLKKNDFKKAENYLSNIIKLQEYDNFNQAISEILKDTIYTFREKKILNKKKNFGNISIISQAFQTCYLKKDTTQSSFVNLIATPKYL